MEEVILQTKMGSDDYLIEKKIEILMDMQSKKVANELNSIKEAINNLSKEISEIKKHVSENRQPARQEQIRKFESSSESVQEQPKTERSQEKVITQSQNRYGEYQPKDVSIEKFFYSGSNKK